LDSKARCDEADTLTAEQKKELKVVVDSIKQAHSQ
jgi:hypothetical protein